MDRYKRSSIVLTAIFLLAAVGSLQAQFKTNYDFLRKKQQISKSGMLAYTAWSGANLLLGVAMWTGTKGEEKYFGQMNVVWSVINLGIAIPGLLSSLNPVAKEISTKKMIKMQYSSEEIFLINGGLDFLYIGTGALLRSIAYKNPKNRDRLLGYGDAFLINGSFLLFFDFIQYFRHRHSRKKAGNLFLDRISFSKTGFGLQYNF